MNEYIFSDIEIGMSAEFEQTVTAEMEEAFRNLSGDINPLHYDDNFALSFDDNRFSSHVTFGMLTASFYSTLAGVYLPGKYSLIHSFDELSFLRPVYADDHLKIKGSVTDTDPQFKLIRVKASITNQHDQIVSRSKMKILVLK